MYANQDLRKSFDSSMTKEDSIRSSIRPTSLAEKITIDRRQYIKLMNFLKNASNINLENKGIYTKTSTTEVDTQTEKVDPVSETNLKEDHAETIEILRFENKSHVENMKLLNDYNKDLLEQIEVQKMNNKKHEEVINKLSEHIENLNSKIVEKDDFITNLQNEIERLEKLNKKNLMLYRNNRASFQDDNKDDTETDESTHENQKVNNEHYLYKDNVLKNITKYLLPADYFLLMNTSKSLRNTFRSDIDGIISQLKKEIVIKNLKIKKLTERDFNLEYEVTDKDLERLLREYILLKKLPGRELRIISTSALSYLNNEIKKSLGEKHITEQPKKKSIFGSMSNVFNKFIKKKDDLLKKIGGGENDSTTDYEKNVQKIK
jgi:hypothetical protein